MNNITAQNVKGKEYRFHHTMIYVEESWANKNISR